MPVIINEFEIEVEAPTPTTPAPPAEKKVQTPPAPRSADVIRIHEWHQQRMARLQAD